ncbi:hypothetical protein HELRODRAFT_114375 [Helobdella robusta]|uniref:Deacetylase sirtuin-type domain-containing protein n=1 Tax=Helobdella robusta TaxID=6412 RepID=T1EG11_HELRO|nr:hypothetical protein HELRODRAFT_114375 [Helobdella robusta]ESN97011.1 hypothetical protein HELRODRAFT_114375 [Helobdella robusta]
MAAKSIARRFSTCLNKLCDTVPRSCPPNERELLLVNDFVSESKKLLVITGAGVSTESGIPDYRSPDIGLYSRRTRPILNYNDFMCSDVLRKRYWLRNFVSWPKLSATQPNATHKSFAHWERKGLVHFLVTQNIDRLHMRAGSKKVVELHGNIHQVICTQCGEVTTRYKVQEMMQQLNSDWLKEIKPANHIALDGDVLVSDSIVNQFIPPKCDTCGGAMKCDVIFFGEAVPQWIVTSVQNLVKECDSMLVAGSSLHVYSAFHFVQLARHQDKKIAIINIGVTRADKMADIKIDAKCGDVIPHLVL